MLAFICLFFPALLFLCIYEKLLKTTLSLREVLYLYPCGNLLINGFCLLAKRIFFHTADYSLYLGGDMVPSVALNYLIMAVPVSIVAAAVAVLAVKNIEVTVEHDDNG